MKKTLSIALIVLLSAAPSRLLAKGATTKVVIEGPDLSNPIEIIDRKILANFNVWAGPQPGFNADAPSFIVDWSQGPVSEPQSLRRYQVSFYSDEISKDRPIYVVYYAMNQDSWAGYVYLPAWHVNMRTIVRGLEGKWFQAWSEWESVARPLIEKARAVNSIPSRLSPEKSPNR